MSGTLVAPSLRLGTGRETDTGYVLSRYRYLCAPNNYVRKNKSRRLIERVHWLNRFMVVHYILVHSSMVLLILTEQEHSVSLRDEINSHSINREVVSKS